MAQQTWVELRDGTIAALDDVAQKLAALRKDLTEAEDVKSAFTEIGDQAAADDEPEDPEDDDQTTAFETLCTAFRDAVDGMHALSGDLRNAAEATEKAI